MTWGFGAIANKGTQNLMIDFALGGPTTTTGANLNASLGNALVEVGELGAMYFTDVGHQPDGPHYWAVDIQAAGAPQRWYYDGAGLLDVSINDDGSFTLSGQGQTITGTVVSTA